jgi:hypothetical protein
MLLGLYFGDSVIALYFAVANMNHAMRMIRNIEFVRDQHNGISSPMQPFKERHDLVAGIRVESASRFIG